MNNTTTKKKKRVQISKKKRFEVFKRDLFTCQYCGATPPSVVLHVDHIVPVAEGGDNDETNLVTSCQPCNLGKGARSLLSVPQSLSEKAKETSEREQQIAGFESVMRERRERIESDAWAVADIFIEHFLQDGIRRDWFASVKRFVEMMGLNDCIESMEFAVYKIPRSKASCFKYFCGICWRKIREADHGSI